MKLLFHLVALAILAMPTAALADDLVVTFYYPSEGVDVSWTVHGVENGQIPTVTYETSESEGISLETDLEFTDDQTVTMTFRVYAVTYKRDRRDSSKTVATKRLLEVPPIRPVQTVGDSQVFVKSGNADGTIFEITAECVTTEDEVEEAVEE